MATLAITGNQEQLLRLASQIEQAAQESQQRTTTITIDSSLGAIGGVSISGGKQHNT